MTRRTVTATIAGVLTCGALAAAVPADPATLLFEAARQKATIEGDLPAAIAQYETFLKSYGQSHRVLAAQALLRLAEAYARLRDPRARASYQRIMREYADQPTALAEARARLGSVSSSQTELRLRKVMDGGHFESAVSPDGRYLTYNNSGLANALILRDLATGVERTIFRGYVNESAFSKDGTQIAFSGNGIKVMSFRDGTVGEPRTIFTPTGAYVGVFDWSPDGRSLAVYLQSRGVLQLGVLRVADGTPPQVLRTIEWTSGIQAFFAPDGDLAVSEPVAEDDGASDIYLMAPDGSRRVALVKHPAADAPLGWTPDGRALLFRSNRGNSIGIWAQAVANRGPVGEPVLVQANVGTDVRAIGVTRAGVLYFGTRTFTQDVEVASLTPTASGTPTPPVRPIRTQAERNHLPTWSKDGKLLAYVSLRREGLSIGIRSEDSGTERGLSIGSQTDRAYGLSWAPDGRYLAAWGRDPRGRYGLYRIDSTSGSMTPIELRSPPPIGLEGYGWSPDGTRMYYRGIITGTIVERDLATGTERVVAEGNAREGEDEEGRRFNRWYGPISVSPDGQWIATSRADLTAGASMLLLVPVGGGQPRELLRVNYPHVFDPYIAAPQWMPDGRSVVALKMLSEKQGEFWQVPIDGAPARKLDIDANRLAPDFRIFRVHPNGRQIAYVAGEDRNEVWALENFLPIRAARP